MAGSGERVREERQPMVRLNRNEAIVDMMLYGVGLYKRPCQPIDEYRDEVPPVRCHHIERNEICNCGKDKTLSFIESLIGNHIMNRKAR